jgi:Trypsin-like peptidase domain
MLRRPIWTLGRVKIVPVSEGFAVRLTRAARKCVVFLGYPDPGNPETGIICQGTGFLVLYQGGFYLVTARHVAELLGDVGFCTRVNTHDGKSRNVPADQKVTWVYHPDSAVDVAVVGFGISATAGFDFLYLDEILLPTREKEVDPDFVDIGDLVYTVGLWRVLVGEERNLPVVHTGHVARLPGEEKIPVQGALGRTELVDAYLVEAQTLSGLSGSPVFLRPSVLVGFDNVKKREDPEKEVRLELIAYEERVALLGLWQAAWDAKAGEVLSADRGAPLTVPAGMGVVVPASKIVEVLELPILRERRAAEQRRREQSNAAKPQAIGVIHPSSVTSPEAVENPDHLEDFTRLVRAASKRKPKGDRT